MGFASLADFSIIQVIQSWQYLFMFNKENERRSQEVMLQAHQRKAIQNIH